MVHQIDGGQPGGDLRLGDAVQPLVHLIGQKIGGRPQQIHRHQPVGHAPDHLVAIRPDRGQVEIVIEQRQRIHRLHLVGAALEEQVDEGGAHIVLGDARRVLAVEILGRHPQGLQAVAPLAAAEIERGQLAQGLQFQPVAAPAEAQPLQLLDGLRRGDGAGVQRRIGVIEDRLRRQSFIAAFFHRHEMRGGGVDSGFPPPAMRACASSAASASVRSRSLGSRVSAASARSSRPMPSAASASARWRAACQSVG